MEVFVNNVRIEVPRGASLRDILSIASAPYVHGAIIAVGKGERSIERKTNKFIIETTKGLIIFEVYSKKQLKLLNKTLRKTKEIMNIRFVSVNCIFVGSFDLNTQGQYRRYEIEEGDIFLSLIGLNIHDSCLVLSKERHEALYSIPEGEKLGRIVAGKEVLHRLSNKDYIKNIKPIITQEITRKNYCKTTNLDLKIDEKWSKIYTFLRVTLFKKLPKSSELFLSLTRNKHFEITFTTRSFVSSENLKGFKVSEENLLKRTRGCITIRKMGKGEGRVYIYKENRYPVSSHVVIGEVTDGMILVDLAQKGDRITVETNPQRINVIGLTQLEAEKRLSELNIRQIRRGATSDKMIVVTQKPLLTMNILDSGSVETFGIDPKKIIKVKLFYDRAPDSVKYFRLATGKGGYAYWCRIIYEKHES